MRIGIILDNPKRDLSGVSLIAYHLLRHGHDVFIIPMYDQGYDVPFLGLDCIIVNYARTSNLESLNAYKQLGITIFVLDTEGGLMPDFGEGSPESWAKRVYAIGASRFIDHYMFWGRRHYEAFKEYSGIAEERLHVTGSPRHDVCHAKWRATLQHAHSGFILINLNFPSINPWWGKAHVSLDQDRIICESAREEMSNTSKVIAVDLAKAHRFQAQLLSTLNEYMRTIRSLAASNPERAFVIRPHPFENQDVYKAFFAAIPNVTVDGSGEVISVINAADLVLHLNCGTSVETRLLGKVPVSLEFLNSELVKCNVNVPCKISYPVKGIEELDTVVKNTDAIPYQYRQQNSYCHELDPWFFGVDGKAAERAADIVVQSLVQHPRTTTMSRVLRGLASCHKRPKSRHLVLGVLAFLLGSRRLASFRNAMRPQRGMKYADVHTVQTKIDSFAQCERSLLRYSVMPARHSMTGFELSTIHLAPLEPVVAANQS